MDALTFFLDSITPFWRTYGKRIGEDVQDFLIIPWYRNEFTGEAKRYNIEHLPRRSLRHWTALLLLSILWLSLAVLQARGAIYFTVQVGIPWIGDAGVWWLFFPVYVIFLLIQWCAVVFEICVILAQLGIVIWWLGWSVKLFT